MRAPVLAHDDKRRDFERYGRGWDDFMQARARNPPTGWSLRERDLYFKGFGAARDAAERFRNNP